MILPSEEQKTPRQPALPAEAATIAMSCRVRLARNLAGERFPDWATERDRERILDAVHEAMDKDAPELGMVPIAGIEAQDRDVLYESRLISRELMERAAGGGMAVGTGWLGLRHDQ